MERTKQCVNTRIIRYAEVPYCVICLYYIFSLGSYVLRGYVSSRVRNACNIGPNCAQGSMVKGISTIFFR
jgi:hypothetical protein